MKIAFLRYAAAHTWVLKIDGSDIAPFSTSFKTVTWARANGYTVA